MGANVLQLDAKDNVLVAQSDLRQGDEVSFGGHSYRLKTGVPAKHKFATQEIGKDGAVVIIGSKWPKWYLSLNILHVERRHCGVANRHWAQTLVRGVRLGSGEHQKRA